MSFLDGIHDLRLWICRNIKDISFLNLNYKVWNILTYSESFRYKRSLSIHNEDMPVCLNNYNCQSLRPYRFLIKINGIHALPPYNLQKVSIISCYNFHSLENMNQNSIYSLRRLK